MNRLLELVSDFVERVAEPEHGPAVNDAYALAFERALEEDRRLTEQMGAVDESDVWTLSSAGWWWFLNQAQSEGYRISDDFLGALHARSRSPLLRYKVIETALRRVGDRPVPENLPRWLLAEIHEAGRGPRNQGHREEPHPREREEPDTADELLQALFQVGDNAARFALALLVQVREDLQERASLLLPNVDPEVRAEWLTPTRPGDDSLV
jgi:hypothetical protein